MEKRKYIMNDSLNWAKYLKSKNVKRLMLEIRKKYISYGKLAGKITIKDTSKEERKDIGGIIGKHYSTNDITITAKEIDNAIKTSVYNKANIKDIIDAYFNLETITSKQSSENKNNADLAFYNSLIEILNKNNVSKKITEWLDYSYANKKQGYRILQNIRKENPKEVLTIFDNVTKGIKQIIEKNSINLPIAQFASNISGNPHFLDKNSQSASLFVSILAYIYKEEYPSSSKKWYELLEKAGLIKNEIAGNVAIYNVNLIKDGKPHKGALGCYEYHEIFMVSYNNLNSIDKATTANNRAYIVENEMVFTLLQKQIKDCDTALICTSGQLSITATKLIELLVKGNTKIYYSGDIDPEGLGICDRLWQKHPNNIIPWHMETNDYLDSISNVDVSLKRLSSLNKIENTILRKTAQVLSDRKKAGYQENIIDYYLKDLK